MKIFTIIVLHFLFLNACLEATKSSIDVNSPNGSAFTGILVAGQNLASKANTSSSSATTTTETTTTGTATSGTGTTATLFKWSRVYGGADTIYALSSTDDFVYAWGENGNGQLGANLDPNVTSKVSTPVKVCADTSCSTYLKASEVAEFNTSDWYVWIRKTDGTLWGWGHNRNGNLAGYVAAGEHGFNVNYKSPVQMYLNSARTLPITNVSQIANGYQHNIYLDTSGNIRGLGYSVYTVDATNNYYQVPQLTKSSTAFGSPISKIFSILSASYAITNDGNLWVWGYTQAFGDNNYTRTQNTCSANVNLCFNHVKICSPTDPAALNSQCTSFLNGVKYISGTGNPVTQALLNNGEVYSWGASNNGEHGAGNIAGNIYKPVKMQMATSVISIVNNSLGNTYHTLVVDQNGNVYAAGANWDGQLGNGATVDSNLPVQVCLDATCNPFKVSVDSITSGNRDVITRGRNWSAAIKDDGTLWVWGGDGGSGIFGNGQFTVTSSYPKMVNK